MSPVSRSLTYGMLWVIGLMTGCATTPPYDYSTFRQLRPRSILVLPPKNFTTDVDAPYTYLSTITRPLAECGYYVYPVAVIDAYMKENGLPSSEEMHAVSLKKIREIIGADAVLYVTIEEWGQKYIVVQSVTTIKTKVQLVDTVSGNLIWQGTQEVSRGSGGGGDPIGMLIAAAMTQVMNSLVDYTHGLSRQANFGMIYNAYDGFLKGPYLSKTEIDGCGKRH